MADPALTGLDNVSFAENAVNAAPRIIDANVAFTDADDDFDGGTLTVTGLLAEDTVSINNQGSGAGQIGYNSGTGEVSYGGVVIGLAVGGVGGILTVTFDADATAAAIDALIQNLTYGNSSNTPTASRDLILYITDSAGNSLLGHPTFSQRTGTANPFNGFDVGTWSAPALADLDNDGDLDVQSGNFYGELSYFQNSGSASAPAFTNSTPQPSPRSAPTAFADLDNDGDIDAVVGDPWGGLSYYENTGTISAPILTQRTGASNPFVSFNVDRFSSPTFVDLDADGDHDLIVGQYDGALFYFENTGTASSPLYAARTGGANPFNGVDIGIFSAPAFADLDNDGDLDTLVGEDTGLLLYFENTGTAAGPAFTQRTSAANPFSGVDVGDWSTPAFADLDDDGDLDVVIGEYDGNLNYFENVTVPGRKVTVAVTAEADSPTVAADNLFYGATADTIFALGGNDAIDAGAGNDTVDGGEGDDVIGGGEGDDYLKGGLGADAMNGGLGDDTYVVDDAGDTTDETGGDGTDLVISRVNWTLGAGLENLTLGNGGTLTGTGNELANVITGNSVANTLNGLTGNDTLSGGGGDDILNGGDDNDTLDGGTQNDTLNGGSGTDTLNGGAGNDALDGGTGIDAMTGGAGNDSYVVDHVDDTVIEAAAGGTDAVSASVSFDLSANVENITLTGSGDIQSFGNVLGNTMTGNSGANHLVGGLGNDTLNGMDGDDSMLGEEGNDTLIGGNGADALSGEEGSDRLTGGAGADIFMFWDTDMRRSALGQTAWEDTITDIDFAGGDRIDLSAIDANVLTLGVDDAFVFVAKLTGVAGQAAMTVSGGRTFVRFDIDGDGKADLTLILNGDQRASQTDVNATAADGGWYL